MRIAVTLAASGAMWLAATGFVRAGEDAYTIEVTFTNRTNWNVAFFLSGGQGLQTRLNPGRWRTFEVTVDPGTEPYVRIYQPYGRYIDFSLADGGRYAFRMNQGRIENSYDQ